MPKGRLVITVKGRFLAWRVCVCAYVCVEFADGFFQPRLLMWGRMKAALRIQYVARRKSSSSTTFLCISPIFLLSFISLSHSPATLYPCYLLLTASPLPSVVSLSNFPYTCSPLFLWSLFPCHSCLHACTHLYPLVSLSTLFYFLSLHSWPLAFPPMWAVKDIAQSMMISRSNVPRNQGLHRHELKSIFSMAFMFLSNIFSALKFIS